MSPNHLSRRQFLQALGYGGLTAATCGVPWYARAAAAPDAWMAAFTQSKSSWTLAYQTAALDLAAPHCAVTGRFPAALTGTLYRNGPAGHDLGGLRYHHWFDGDGMIQRFAIERDAVAHVGKYIRTPKFKAEQEAKKRLVEAFGTKLPDLIPLDSPDRLNVANTSVLPLNGELLALWEGGSAVRLDPATLDAHGVKTWREDLTGVPFSAHPRVDPTGTIWNFGVGSGQGTLILYQIDRDGSLKRAEAIPVADVPMIHDFVVTEKHLIFLMPPLVMDRSRFATQSFLDSHIWRPELGMRILVIDKSDWSQRKSFELPAAFLFHLGNAWEDGEGTIRLDYVHADGPDVLFHATRDVMRGEYSECPIPKLAVVTLDLQTGQAKREVLPIEAEFPRIDARLTGLRHRQVLHASGHAQERPGFTAVALTNVETGASERFEYGPKRMVEEHIYVPGTGTQGWILGTTLDLERKCSVLSCFSAGHLSDGPVAEATLPYALPLGLHGMFVAA